MKHRKILVYFLVTVLAVLAAVLTAGCSGEKASEYLNVSEEWFRIDKEAGTFKYFCVLENTDTDRIIHCDEVKLTGYDTEGNKVGKTVPTHYSSANIYPGQKAAFCIDGEDISQYWPDSDVVPEEIYCSITSSFRKEPAPVVLSMTHCSENGSGPYGTEFSVILKNDGDTAYSSAGDVEKCGWCNFAIAARDSNGKITDAVSGFNESDFTVDPGDEASFMLFGEVTGADHYDVYFSWED